MIEVATSRIWIYQSDRFLTSKEAERFNELFSTFMADWKAHGAPLQASFELKDQLFLIINVDEGVQEATGCSVDASVHAIKQIQTELGVNFFNRQRVAYRSGDEVLQCSMAEFKALAKEGKLNEDTLVFNNTISAVSEFKSNWEVPAGKSWHKMLLK